MSDDIVARLRQTHRVGCDCVGCEAADEIERLRKLIDKWTQVGISNLQEIIRLRNELAARCGDHGPGAHTAGPVEHFIPEAL